MTSPSPSPAPQPSVLVIEDEAPIRDLLATTLKTEGYQVFEADTARRGETMAGNRRVDVFLIDLGLPDDDGVALIRRLRGWTQRPIIVLSARAQESQKVQALDAGADDYLTKPFGVAELHARLRVALRNSARSALDGASRLQLSGVTLDLAAKTAVGPAGPIKLTSTEWRLLEVLARHAGSVVTSSALMKEVWGPGHAEQRHYLRIYVHALRQKLEAAPSRPVHLINVTGVGYRLVPGDARDAG